MSLTIATARNHPLYPALETSIQHLHSNKLIKPIRRPLAWLASYVDTKAGETSQVEVFWGDTLNVVRPDGVSVSTSRYRVYEPELTTAFIALVKPSMTVYDVGAHFGYFSLLANHLVGPTGSVVSFEPTPSTYNVLASNLDAKPNCTLINKAAWSEQSTLKIQDFGIASGAYNSVFSPRHTQLRDNKNVVTHDIEAVRLDDIMTQTKKKPDFVKIDTESAEQNVIEGANTILKECRPIVSMELGEMGVNSAMKSADLVQLLCGFSYTPLEVKGADLVRHTPLQSYKFSNLLFVPNESPLLS